MCLADCNCSAGCSQGVMLGPTHQCAALRCCLWREYQLHHEYAVAAAALAVELVLPYDTVALTLRQQHSTQQAGQCLAAAYYCSLQQCSCTLGTNPCRLLIVCYTFTKRDATTVGADAAAHALRVATCALHQPHHAYIAAGAAAGADVAGMGYTVLTVHTPQRRVQEPLPQWTPTRGAGQTPGGAGQQRVHSDVSAASGGRRQAVPQPKARQLSKHLTPSGPRDGRSSTKPCIPGLSPVCQRRTVACSLSVCCALPPAVGCAPAAASPARGPCRPRTG